MDKRRAKRIIAGYKAEITFEDKTYDGVIENLSASGASLTIRDQEKDLNFTLGETLKLQFEIQPGEMLSLNCTIKWFTKSPALGRINSIGVQIQDPNWEECKSFL